MTETMIRRAVGTALSMLLTGAAMAADVWPSKPVRVIVPFTAGSSADITGRVIAEQLASQLGQPFVVENRPGASGVMGTTAVAKAPADGYTILITTASWTVLPATNPNLPFDAAKDFRGIAVLAGIPNVLVVRPDAKINSVAELVAAAKVRPGKLNYGTVGMGSANHLNAARFQIGAGIQALQVPYNGTPAVITELIGGRVDFCLCPISNVLPMVKDGRLQPLAVGSSRRAAALPNIPTTEEAGVPNSALDFWIGMAVASKTPQDIVDRLHAETVKALNRADVRARLATLGGEVQIYTPSQFDNLIREQIKSNAELVKAANIKVE